MRQWSCGPFIAASILLFVAAAGTAVAQNADQSNRYALVIGNANYDDIGRLKNPVNDAKDMATALRTLGFNVALLLDAELGSMEDALVLFGNKLSALSGSMGFFYYAGHGVQSGGVNYLIPVDARIVSETFLKTKALPLPAVLDTMRESRCALSVIVLDACRDNPFGWGRSGSRGLSVVGAQPSGSIVAYATSVGFVAQDGPGQNGVFTSELLKHIQTPDVEIKEVFNRTGAGVQEATMGLQTPAIYNQFFGSAFLAGRSAAPKIPPVQTTTTTAAPTLLGNLFVRTNSAGSLFLDGKPYGDIRSGGAKRLTDLDIGWYEIEMRYSSEDREKISVQIEGGKEKEVAFLGVPSSSTTSTSTTTSTTTTSTTTTTIQRLTTGWIEMVSVEGGSFVMGSTSKEIFEKPAHSVTLDPFMIGKYEVTQEQYKKVMGKNPSKYMKSSDAAHHPVEQVTWYDSVSFCNVLSEREGLQKVYIINGRYVLADFSKNGYRLPTEAEWEYAALGGSLTRKYMYSGSDDIDQAAWYEGNSKDTTHVVGMKAPNELGLYDMSGNVQEWCGDFFGYYRTEPLANPAGWSFGNNRVKRGGSYDISAFYARSGSRVSLDPGYNDCDTGFRLVRRP